MPLILFFKFFSCPKMQIIPVSSVVAIKVPSVEISCLKKHPNKTRSLSYLDRTACF
jgi:hypothetical protein